jgi:hypothetical protein
MTVSASALSLGRAANPSDAAFLLISEFVGDRGSGIEGCDVEADADRTGSVG